MLAGVELRPNPKIAVAIPAYNVAGHIETVIKKTQQCVRRVIVVDDGSRDETSQCAARAGADIVLHEHNRGYGGAIKSGLEAANRALVDIVVTLDGDGQHDPREIPAIIRPIVTGQADIVIGSRFLDHRSSMPVYRQFGIKVITGLYNAFSSVKLTDAQSGFRAYNQKALSLLLPLQENGMAISTEIIIKARKLGLRMLEVPITITYHEDSSTLHPVAHGLSVALATIIQRFQIESRFSGRDNSNHAGSDNREPCGDSNG
jgi:glycosyltransferase involved in cell wall biosynthesis